jgi:hypothetical protein
MQSWRAELTNDCQHRRGQPCERSSPDVQLGAPPDVSGGVSVHNENRMESQAAGARRPRGFRRRWGALFLSLALLTSGATAVLAVTSATTAGASGGTYGFAFVTPPTVNLIEGVTNTFNVVTTGSPLVVFQQSGPLPTGVTFDNDTGTFSGTPEQTGTFDDTITAAGTVAPEGIPIIVVLTQAFTLVVSNWGIVPQQIPPAVVGQFYQLQLVEAGAPGGVKWKKIGALPKGLKLNPTTGLLSGTPGKKVTPGDKTVTVEVVTVGKNRSSSSASLVIAFSS